MLPFINKHCNWNTRDERLENGAISTQLWTFCGYVKEDGFPSVVMMPGLQAAIYFLYFNTFPIFPYIVFKCPIIPIFLTSLKEKKVFCWLFLHWWMEQRQQFSWPK